MIEKITIIILAIGIVSDIILNFRKWDSTLYKRLFLAKSITVQLVAIAALTLYRDKLDIFIIGWILTIYFTIYLPQSIYTIATLAIRSRKARGAIKIASAIFPIIMVYGMTIGTHCSKVENIEIESSKLPESFDNFRIIHITDLHLKGRDPNGGFYKRVVQKINNLKPDIVVITGDFVTYKGEEFIPFEQLFSNIESKYGIYTVLGNHDYCSYYKWENRDDATRSLADLTNSIKKIGWQMLSNDSREITIAGDTINIIGVEHLGGADARGNIREAIKGCNSSHYNILLSHTPESWASDISANYPIDLTLSGHTHAMQLKLKIFGKQYSPSSLLFKQWSGLYQKSEKYLYINDGLGYTGIPLRLGTLPEITVITLKTSPSDN